MSNRECNIVRDLLPLYVEDIVSEDTKQFVNEHLSECDDCKKELNLLKSDIFINENETETDASTEIMKKIRFGINKKRIFTAILSSVLSFIIAILLFAYLTAPVYIPYSEGNNLVKVNENDGIVTLSFSNQYELTNGLGVGTYYLSLYNTSLNSIFNSTSEKVITINPNGEKVRTIYYVSNGVVEDKVIYGLNPNVYGGVITLPRLFLGYYFLIANFIAVILIILYVIFRKKERARSKIIKLLFVPISYILSHLMIMGRSSVSYSATRDLCLILLLGIPIYLIFYIIYKKKRG